MTNLNDMRERNDKAWQTKHNRDEQAQRLAETVEGFLAGESTQKALAVELAAFRLATALAVKAAADYHNS